MTVKSQLVQNIDLNVSGFKLKARKILDAFVSKYCPETLKGFDEKYPQLGSYKKDVTRVAYLFIVKMTFVVIVLPIIVVVTLIESLKTLFTRKGK